MTEPSSLLALSGFGQKMNERAFELHSIRKLAESQKGRISVQTKSAQYQRSEVGFEGMLRPVIFPNHFNRFISRVHQ